MDRFQPGCDPLRPGHHAGMALLHAEVTFPPARRHPAAPGEHEPPCPAASPPSHAWSIPGCGHPGSFPAIPRTQPAPGPQLLQRPPLTCAAAWCGGTGGLQLPWLPRFSPALSLPVFSAEYVLSKTKPCIKLPASSQLIRLPVLLLLLNIARWLPAPPESQHLTNAV